VVGHSDGGDRGQLSGTFTEVKARRPRSVLGWVTTRERRCEPGSVRRFGFKYVTDRLYSRYCADTYVK